MGEYTLSRDDILSAKRFGDATGRGATPIAIHGGSKNKGKFSWIKSEEGGIPAYDIPLFWPGDVIAKPVPKMWISISPPREWSYRRMIQYFIKCILENKEPELTSGKDGAKVIEIICGVFKSMETNSWVDLPLKEEGGLR